MKLRLALVLRRKLSALKKIFADDPRVLAVFLFGSQVDGYATPRSDIDLAVLYDRNPTFDEEFGLQIAITETLQTDDVDVVNLNRASLLLRYRAISGELLYERDYVRVSDFIEETWRYYPDYEFWLERFNEDYIAGMRKEYARFRYKKNRRTEKDHRKQSVPTRGAAR